MPLVSTCSAAISAACHRPEMDIDAHLLPVQWEVVENDGTGPERCAFTTSRYVYPPVPGKEYLGVSADRLKPGRGWLDRVRWKSMMELVRRIKRD